MAHSIVYSDSVSGQRRPRSDCASAQSDLGLCYPHKPRIHIFAWHGKQNVGVSRPLTMLSVCSKSQADKLLSTIHVCLPLHTNIPIVDAWPKKRALCHFRTAEDNEGPTQPAHSYSLTSVFFVNLQNQTTLQNISAKREGFDRTILICRLFLAYAVRIWHKCSFRTFRFIYFVIRGNCVYKFQSVRSKTWKFAVWK